MIWGGTRARCFGPPSERERKEPKTEGVQSGVNCCRYCKVPGQKAGTLLAENDHYDHYYSRSEPCTNRYRRPSLSSANEVPRPNHRECKRTSIKSPCCIAISLRFRLVKDRRNHDAHWHNDA